MIREPERIRTLSGKTVIIPAASGPYTLVKGDLVVETNDRNPSYLGVVEIIHNTEVPTATVKWLKFGPFADADNWSENIRCERLTRLTLLR